MITVDRNSSFSVSGIQNLYNEHKYSGISNMLTLSRVYTTSFTCKFNMAHYPFDVQTCTMTFIPQVTLLIQFNAFSVIKLNLRATTEILPSLRRDSFVTWVQLICLNITSKVSLLPTMMSYLKQLLMGTQACMSKLFCGEGF